MVIPYTAYYTFDSESIDDLIEIELKSHFWMDSFDLQLSAEKAAEDYYNNHDGWELASSWNGNTNKITLWDSEKNPIATFNVMLEFEPTFSAYQVKDSK